jgi:hypothetical protein
MHELMNTTLTLVALGAVATAVGLFARRTWLRRITVALLAGIALFTVVFTMNDLRAHGSEARSLGRSQDFIAGMAERDQKTTPRRAVVFFSVCGLALLALSGPRKDPRP